MKKLIALLMLCAFLFGCGAAAQESEFWKHDTMYKNWDHMKYSWSGYKSPTAESGKKSLDEGWWGSQVPYVPAK